MAKVFAPDWPRNEQGWIMFPLSDTAERKAIFPPRAMEHPAKACIEMIREIVKYVSMPGEVILDPMAGSGTIMLAWSELGRGVIAIEIVPYYADIIREYVASVDDPPNPDANAVVLNGDCQRLLPLPGACHHVIFSPPYATALKRRSTGGERDLATSTDVFVGDITQYSDVQGNVGSLNPFFHNQAMEGIYRKLFETVRPGGTMTVIIKDYIEGGKRVPLGNRCVAMCLGLGWKLLEWHKRESKGTIFLSIRRAKGLITVDDEDMIMFGRPR